MAKSKTVVTPKNQHLFVALAELMNEDNLSEAEIVTYLNTEKQYLKTKRLADRRKKALDKRLARIVQVTLGIKDMDEFKLLTPEKVNKLFEKRYSEGAFTMEKGIAFLKKTSRVKLSYKDELTKAIGDAAVAQIVEDAPTRYSYTIYEPNEAVN